MFEQFLQMLQKLPMQGGGMPLGGLAAGTPMGGAAAPISGPFPIAPPPKTPMDAASQLANAAQGFQKGMGSVPRTAPPQVATPQVKAPAPYQPNMPSASGMGTSGGGDPMQMLMMLPGMQQMLGAGGGAMPDQIGNLPKQPGAGMPSLSQLMMMGRR